MKRFVDVRQAEMGSYRFAWWDTVVDSFETHGGNMAWHHWDDFVEDYKGDDLLRYEVLIPEWVLEVTDERRYGSTQA